MKTRTTTANYGQEMTGFMILAGVISIVLILIAAWQGIRMGITGSTTGIWLVISCILTSILCMAFTGAGLWSSRVGKYRMRDRIFSLLDLKGDEDVLDVGCGRGLLLIEAGKRLTTGSATGADHWQGTAEYKYTAEMARENARIEGVSEKIRIVDGEATSLPFADDSYDVVMTSLMMHHVKDTRLALKEMIRVLKDNGVLVIADIAAHRFIPELEKIGVKEIKSEWATRLFFMPVYILICKK